MAQKLEFTKAELTEAFRKHNVEYLKNPEDFIEIDDSVDVAQSQAEKLIELLQTS